MRSLPFLPRHLLSERWPFFLLPFRLRLLLLSHPLSSPPITLLQFYQAVKDGSSLVVTPSSIPSSATCGPDVDLSSKGSEDLLEDPDDELVSKKRISDSNKEENVPPEAKFIGICISPFFFFCFCQVHSYPFCHLLPYTYVLASPLLLQSPFTCVPTSLLLQRLLRGQGS